MIDVRLLLGKFTTPEAPKTMTIETIDATLIPPTAFVRRSRLLDSKEWKEAVAALPSIKAGKAIRVVLSPETLQMSKNAAFAFKRHLVDHIHDAKLKLEVAIRGRARGRAGDLRVQSGDEIATSDEIRSRPDRQYAWRTKGNAGGW